MKRIAAVISLAAAASLLTLAPAQADPSLCLTYDVDVNGQGQAGTQCLPPADGPTLPGLPGLGG
jgi:hypothetical protein